MRRWLDRRRSRGLVTWLALAGLSQSACVGPWLAPRPISSPNNVKVGGLRPLLTDWDPNERTFLNQSRTRGPLAVHFADGVLEPLFDCRVKGSYEYSAQGSVQVEDEVIENQDELHATMPAYGARFEGFLASGNKLHVRMSVVGNYGIARAVTRKDLDGDCARATHVATFVTVGAFRLFTLSRGEGGVNAGAGEADLGARGASVEQDLNQAGDEAACDTATSADRAPPAACSTSLMLNLASLDPPPPPPPTGTPKWLFFGAAATSLAALGVASGIAVHASNEQDAELAKSVYDRDANVRSSIQAQATTANILFVGGGVLGIGAVVLAFTTRWKTESSAPSVAAAVTPWIGDSGAGLGAHGSF